MTRNLAAWVLAVVWAAILGAFAGGHYGRKQAAPLSLVCELTSAVDGPRWLLNPAPLASGDSFRTHLPDGTIELACLVKP